MQPITVFYIVLFYLLWAAGLVVNVILLLVFIRHRETRTPDNVLLINLCIGDLAYLLSFLLSISLISIDNGAPCFIIIFCRCLVIALNTYSVAAISIQRYVGLVTFRNRLPVDAMSYTHPLLILAGLWIVAIVASAVEVHVIKTYLNSSYCAEAYYIGVSLYRMLTYGIIPSLIIAVFYIAAAHRVNRSARQLPGEDCEAFVAVREARKRSARTLFALAIVFFLTYVPLFMFLFFFDYYITLRSIKGMDTMLHVSHLMSTFNPIFNPIALYVASKQLREFYKIYCCCCCYRQLSDSLETTEAAQTSSTNRQEIMLN